MKFLLTYELFESLKNNKIKHGVGDREKIDKIYNRLIEIHEKIKSDKDLNREQKKRLRKEFMRLSKELKELSKK